MCLFQQTSEHLSVQLNAHKRVWKPEIHKDNRHDELIGVVTFRRVINVACRSGDGQVRVSRSSVAALLQLCCSSVARRRWTSACLTRPERDSALSPHDKDASTQFTCFTGPKQNTNTDAAGGLLSDSCTPGSSCCGNVVLLPALAMCMYVYVCMSFRKEKR